MLVKDIIIKSAKLLGLNKVSEYLENNSSSDLSNAYDSLEIPSDIKEDIDKLLIATNLINNTIASLYFEIISTKSISCKNGIIPYGDITNSEIVEIKNIYDDNGVCENYKVMADGVHVANGKWNVVYSYLPSEVSLGDEINYYTKVGEVLFSLGVVSEYLFLIGDINSSSIWNDKFKDEIFAISRPRRNIKLPTKRWC